MSGTQAPTVTTISDLKIESCPRQKSVSTFCPRVSAALACISRIIGVDDDLRILNAKTRCRCKSTAATAAAAAQSVSGPQAGKHSPQYAPAVHGQHRLFQRHTNDSIGPSQWHYVTNQPPQRYRRRKGIATSRFVERGT
jgi:hypothetical protein